MQRKKSSTSSAVMNDSLQDLQKWSVQDTGFKTTDHRQRC